RVCSLLSIDMLTRAHAAFSTMESACQLLVRTNPCAGAVGSSALARNHGKQIGIPPRIAWPSCQRDVVLRKRTSPCPVGSQEVTSAPCRYISPSTCEPVIWIRGRPPLPPRILATPGIPKRRSSFSTADIVSDPAPLARGVSRDGAG